MSDTVPRKELERERERLTRLYEAFETQERELQAAMERVADLERTISEQGRVIHELRTALRGHGIEPPL